MIIANERKMMEEVRKRLLREPPNRAWVPNTRNLAHGRKLQVRATPSSAPKPWQR